MIPVRLSTYDLLFCGFFVFDKEAVIGKAMDFLFGIKEIEMKIFLAASAQGVTGLVLLPVFETSVLKTKELYFGIEVSNKKVEMLLSGTFEFSFLEDVIFRVECYLSNQGFLIEAFAKMEHPKPLFHTFSIGDTCLAIGYQSGFIFQMYCNLYMGKIKMFGALGLSVIGQAVNIDLLSAAVTDITLPIFVESVLGKKINGLDEFDFIQLLGLPFLQVQDFPVERDMSGVQVAEAFNSRVSDKSFALDSGQVQVETFGEGIILIDKKRMRHYYITKTGKLQLQAQFYYAIKSMNLGDYNIAQGIFLCCTIRLFKKVELQVLFSISDTDGVLAYACVSSMDLGFLKLSASYAAIGVAKAALEVAKQIVALGGVIGEGVLKAINGAITAALNLFFIRLIRLESNVSSEEQYFQAEIEFVALGKTYHYQTKLGKKAIAQNPTEILADDINGKMDNDLKNIEKGSFKSNRNRYRREEYTISQHKSRLKDGMQQLESATKLMCRMQDTYVEGCGEIMPEFEEINVSYQQAVNGVAGILDIANRAVDYESMDQAVSMVEQEMKEQKETVRDTTFIPVRSAIADYKEST